MYPVLAYCNHNSIISLKRKIKVSAFNWEQVEIMTWKKTPIQIEILHQAVRHNFLNPIYAFELQISNLWLIIT